MAIIESLMKTEMVTAESDETVAHAAWSMARNEVGALLILESGKLVGILSERDVVARVVAEGRDPTATRVAEVATPDPVSVDVGTHVRACAELLRDKGIRHLPVTRDGKPAGILSSRDFMTYIAGGLERLVDRGRYKEALAEGADPYDHLGGSYGD
jgi:CBS domain-containing protein